MSHTHLVRRATKRAWAGYVPILCLCIGAGAGGWLAVGLGAVEWPLSLLGGIIGYLVSGAILRRVYSDQ